MKKPRIAGKNPAVIELEQGRDYFFCTCGLSNSQPFCDGSHKGTGFRSHKFTADKNGKVWLCLCKQSGTIPFCDGTHKKIRGAAE